MSDQWKCSRSSAGAQGTCQSVEIVSVVRQALRVHENVALVLTSAQEKGKIGTKLIFVQNPVSLPLNFVCKKIQPLLLISCTIRIKLAELAP